ncbi:histidine-containing phosphotransfer protein 4-like [Alnus glutinosa]|uniref:histidine-containing phosphotransfer protein 4-like n=1 Tax=Alnus glutinosa TaxID=3517 RepID=UPI002D77BC9B|nr:histidine-containing phosphotransfer protein 4-like [Alnus glutinosa]
MEINPLQQQIAAMKQSLLAEEILDYEFLRLERLADKDTPNIVEEIFTLYFSDSPKVIASLEQALEELHFDYATVDRYLHRLKGSSMTIGANKVAIQTNQALECCNKGDMEGCKAAVGRIKQEHNTLKNRLQPYFQLIGQARVAKTADRPK